MLIRLRLMLGAVVVVTLVTVVLLGRGSPPPPEPLAAPRPDAKPQAADPDRIILTFKTDPATSQAVTWRTDGTVTVPVAQLALSEDGPGFDPLWGRGKFDPNKVRTHPAESRKLAAATYHSVNFTGLRPKTKYVYRVGSETNWSEWFQFETASTHPEPFGFIYFGDAQNGIKSHWSRVARGAYSEMPKARFIVHAGDLVDNGSSDEQWGEWHAAAGWINGLVPSVPTPGNHEYMGGQKGLTEHWRAQFALPEHGPPGLEETCYFFDYQGVRVVSLNSNELIPEQIPWLERVLKGRPASIRWTILTFHHPIYSTAKERDNGGLRLAWRPVFDAHGVDLVLQGHDHTYGRSGLMRGDNTLTGEEVRTKRGSVYVISVSGAKLYDVGKEPWMEARGQGMQLYQLIRIDGDTLKYESRTARGDLYDSFELRKRPGQGNELVNPDAPRTDGGREYSNAAAAVVIVVVVMLGLGWALRRR